MNIVFNALINMKILCLGHPDEQVETLPPRHQDTKFHEGILCETLCLGTLVAK